MASHKTLVFLSWSGPRSKAMATALRSWLKKVLQTVDPWMSEQDIQAGQVWFNEVAEKLQDTEFAIICVTPENLKAPWLNFEAGAIGMSSRDGFRRRVAPYVLGLDRLRDLGQPLGAFLAKHADRDGTFALVKSINETLSAPVDVADLEDIFDLMWPKLYEAIKAIPADEDAAPPAPLSSDEVLVEILALVRSIASNQVSSASAPGSIWGGERPRVVVSDSEGLRSNFPLTVTTPSGDVVLQLRGPQLYGRPEITSEEDEELRREQAAGDDWRAFEHSEHSDPGDETEPAD